MIENGAIIVKEGKKKIFRILGVTEKKNNKIKYNHAESNNITNLIVRDTMLKFGITLKK